MPMMSGGGMYGMMPYGMGRVRYHSHLCTAIFYPPADYFAVKVGIEPNSRFCHKTARREQKPVKIRNDKWALWFVHTL